MHEARSLNDELSRTNDILSQKEHSEANLFQQVGDYTSALESLKSDNKSLQQQVVKLDSSSLKDLKLIESLNSQVVALQ
jgi:chromosome segregation ATPase